MVKKKVMKNAFLVLFSLFTLFTYAQRINEYEFVVVPTKFQFQRSENEYRLNDLLKNRLEDFGFKAFYKSEQLLNIYSDPCLYLYVDVVNVSNIFLTKLQVVFKDCSNGIVFQSEIGTGEEKERHEGFNEALFNALKSVRYLNYKFNGKKTDLSVLSSTSSTSVALHQNNGSQSQSEVLKIEQVKLDKIKEDLAKTQMKLEQARMELAKLEQAKNSLGKVPQVASQTTNVASSKKVEESAQLVASTSNEIATPKEFKNTVTQNKVTNLEQPKASIVISEPVRATQETVVAEKITNQPANLTDNSSSDVLFASPIENGFELIDSNSKVVLVLVKTMQPEYFNANVDKKYGLVYKKNNQWVFEYYFEGKLMVEPLNIRFK